jgi:hypothetical protein
VRDQHKRRAAAHELVLQPFDRRQVEMVGRFVEKQDVRLRRHHAGKRRTPRLAAGKALWVLFPGQAQMLQEIGDAIAIVAGAEPRFGIGLDRLEAVEVRRLVQIADGHRGVPEDLARLRLGKAGCNPHQRRLAGAIAADETDAVAGFDLQAGAGEKRRAAEGQEDIVEFQNRGRQGVRLRKDRRVGQARPPGRISGKCGPDLPRHWKSSGTTRRAARSRRAGNARFRSTGRKVR